MSRWASRITAMAVLAVVSLTSWHFAAAEPAAKDQVYFIVRHAEKETLFTARDEWKNPLSPEGHARADCLAQVLRDVPLRAVIATDWPRVQQTAFPVVAAAARTGRRLDFQKIPRDEFKQAPQLAASLDRQRGPMLLLGQNDSVLPLAAALGGTLDERTAAQVRAEWGDAAPRPGELAHGVFNWLVVVRTGKGGAKSAVAFKYGPKPDDNAEAWRYPTRGTTAAPCDALRWPLP